MAYAGAPLCTPSRTALLRAGCPFAAAYYYYGDMLYAVRKGPFKAHFTTHGGYSKEPPVEHNPPQLFDIPTDPSEQFDVAAEHPDAVAELAKIAAEHRATVTRSKLQY